MATTGQVRALLAPVVRVAMAPFRGYHQQLMRRPLLVKSLTSGLMLSAADFLSQWLRSPREAHDQASSHPGGDDGGRRRARGWWNVHQTTWMGIYGVFFVSPFCHVWYQVLERMVPLRGVISIAARLRRVAQRVLLDQAVVAPTLASALFLSRGLIAGACLP